ncbi:PREDICTED: putative gustatory receptor 94a [Rhagoletis zephyria]|uniref:putative gustatory receptor 94a n=1 Tax=Rhagoletis zephyria TaxID=28612 RepID=UPI000811A8B8|nr:PREDICTED: putative gustatory receptor 94a [Rhagoletis zephyria]
MEDYKSLKFFIGFFTVTLMLLGLSPNTLSLRQRRFYTSYIMTVYSLVITLVFTISYGHDVINDLRTGQFDLKNAVKLYSYMNILASIISYLTALCLTRIWAQSLNGVALFETMHFFDVRARMVVSSNRLVFLKSLLIPIMQEVTLILQQMYNEPDKNLMWTLYTLLPMIVSQMFPNIFFGTLVISKLLVTTLNEHLGEVVNEVNCLQTALQMSLHKPFYRMQRFCELADRLDLLAQKYKIICEQTTIHLQLHSVPLICSLMCNLCGITASCFTQYLAIADTLVNNEPYNVFNALTNAVFLVISVVEVLLQAQICDENRLKVQETGLILQRISLTHADVRFKQSVEEFSLLVLVIKYKIQPLGLLEINISLFQDVSLYEST